MRTTGTKTITALFLLLATNLIISQEGYTSIPDSNFEKALIDLKFDADGIINGQVLTSKIQTITLLNIEGKGISDLTGIEGFRDLEQLYCRQNYLQKIDISSNTNLITLYCGYNYLSELDLNQNVNLEVLRCNINNLESLSLKSNKKLLKLVMYDNPIEDLDLSNNIDLEYLQIHNENLSSIDLSSNPNLATLYITYTNKITEVNLSNNINLKVVSVSNNDSLTSLSINNGNNSGILDFKATDNKNLAYIEVDNSIDANNGFIPYTYWQKDNGTIYIESTALGVGDILYESLNIYPNPVLDILTINSKLLLKKVEIYSVLGQKVKEVDSEFQSILLNKLETGVYWVKIQGESASVTRKIIKL